MKRRYKFNFSENYAQVSNEKGLILPYAINLLENTPFNFKFLNQYKKWSQGDLHLL